MPFSVGERPHRNFKGFLVITIELVLSAFGKIPFSAVLFVVWLIVCKCKSAVKVTIGFKTPTVMRIRDPVGTA